MSGNNHTSPNKGLVLQKPLDCYRLLLCQLAIASHTGLMSFMNICESWTLPPEAFGKGFPVEAHAGLAGNGRFDVRLIWVHDETGETAAANSDQGDHFDTIDCKVRYRLVMQAIVLPPRPGSWSLMFEWRNAGTTTAWQRSSARCPVVVGTTTATQSRPAQA